MDNAHNPADAKGQGTGTATLSPCPLPRQRTRPLHVVLVDEELPYPPISGKRIRTLNLTLRLARRHRLTYVCHRNADPAEAEEAADHFARQGIRTVVVDRPVPPRRGVRFYARLAANLLSPLPYSVTSHTSAELRRALRQLAAENPVDLWHCEWTPYAESLRAVAGPRLVMAHNVESVIWQRYRETEPNPLARWYITRQWRKYLRFERRALAGADRTVAVSELDAERFRRDFGARQVEVVDNGVDTSYFRPTGEIRDPYTLLFLGSLDWRPNLDGVALLLEKVFPAVRASQPHARLCLVGRNPPAWLHCRAAATPGVELHATVPDVRPYLGRAAALVVPLRIGGGSRLKILEALASATPVVSTRVGAEGLHLEPARHFSQVEDIDDLASALLEVMRDPVAARERAEAGRREVLRLYDWDALADRLERIWLGTAGVEPPGPVERGGFA
jgi:glycosyltransferase involved in cell wall biosynthesis